MMKIKLFVLAILLVVSQISYAADSSLLFNSDEQKKIQVNNRVLAKVNGKAISVHDVMKKMDMLFYRAFPEYTSSSVARYQFYQANWKRVLQELIDKELVMADAEENKMQVSNGDVRQDMETYFGPNIIANLEKVGLTFDEAWKMIHSDIVIKRMLYVRAHSKALKQVTPQVVREAYDRFAIENSQPDRWTYVVISIREKNDAKGAAAAQQIYKLLTEDNIPLSELTVKVEELSPVAKTTKVSVSEEFTHNDKEMSASYKQILTPMTPGTYSQPFVQKSRSDNSNLYRIFFLKKFVAGGAPSFTEASNDIKEKLLEEIAEKETNAYIKRMRKHFDVQEIHLDQINGDDFEPFRLG